MAAFNHPFLFDSTFSPIITALSEDPITFNTTNTPYFYERYQFDPFQNISSDLSNIYASSSHGYSNTQGGLSNKTEAYKQSTDSSSMVVNKLESSDQLTQNSIPMGKKRKCNDGSSTSRNSARSENKIRELKGKKAKKTKEDEKIKKKELEAPTGYVHVRARRGQATDSHSLAERVRREKISERMKILQSLVPGCDNMIGKALVLDEIINYVQSLQTQVEFLSMKLGCVNPIIYDYDMDMDTFMARPEGLSSLDSAVGNSTTTFTTANNNINYYPYVHTSFPLQQPQIPNIALPQGNGQLWDMDSQSQRNIMSLSADQISILRSLH